MSNRLKLHPLHHLPKPLRDRGRAWVTRKAKALEAFETDGWAVARLFEVERFTPQIWEPGVGLGAIAGEAERRGHDVYATDIFNWGWPGTAIKDFLADSTPRPPGFVPIGSPEIDREFSVICNPPFTRACAFVSRAMELGARKVAMFGKMEFLGTDTRRPWLHDHPPARIWMCGTRATCWRFDIPPEKRKGSTPTLHAWFVWEHGQNPGPGGASSIKCIWEN